MKPQPLSKDFLLKRGFCCKNGCTNCPYNMAELHETLMGRKLIEDTLPEIARQLERIADIIEQNKIKELIKVYPNDQELGKHIREYYVRFK